MDWYKRELAAAGSRLEEAEKAKAQVEIDLEARLDDVRRKVRKKEGARATRGRPEGDQRVSERERLGTKGSRSGINREREINLDRIV